MRLTVLLPAYSEERVVGEVVADIRPLYIDPPEAELPVADDESPDGTAEAADRRADGPIRSAHPGRLRGYRKFSPDQGSGGGTQERPGSRGREKLIA
jgi:glycosyltransferase involved in cell wall biosynthesis